MMSKCWLCFGLALGLVGIIACGEEGDGGRAEREVDAVNNEVDDANDEVDDANNEVDDANNEVGDANNEVDEGPTLEERIEAATLTELTFVPASPQRTGDAALGYETLRYGDFVGSGLPYEVFTMFFNEDARNLLGREGDNATLPPSFNAFDAPNGVRVVGGITCFGCHSGFVEGVFTPGLGSNTSNTTEARGGFGLLESLVEGQYGVDSPEAEISRVFLRGAEAVEASTVTPFRGVNSAFRIEEAAASWRSAEDLSWLEVQGFEVNGMGLASDVPPWWNVGKKHALYYNGMGRGDFARMIQQIMVVGLVDQAQAEGINARAGDMLAWVQSVEAPVWPGPVDGALAEQGRALFERECSRCHGTYGPEGEYPNLLVPLDMVGTDPAYARYYVENPGLTDWVNESWFSQDTRMEPLLAYMAPPLDGIWASAPYFHNASVPTLLGVLDSARRPVFWRRDFSDSAVDREAVGLHFEALDVGDADDVTIFDTTVLGYDNGGHTFGDVFSDEERLAVLEYLKTL